MKLVETVFNQIWHTPLSPPEYWVVFGFILLTGLTLGGFFCWSFTQQKKIDPRYRMAIRAGLALTAVATLSYVVIFYKLVRGYAFDAAANIYVPQALSVLDVPARYLDWAITVPLLVVELIGVSALALGQAQRLRIWGAHAGFLMIVTGYAGEVTGTVGENGIWARLGWGLVSSAFFVAVYCIVIYTVVKSTPTFAPALGRTYRGALIVLLAIWFVYPIVYGINGFASGGEWAATAQIAYCCADIISKVGFGLLILRVARLRSLESAG